MPPGLMVMPNSANCRDGFYPVNDAAPVMLRPRELATYVSVVLVIVIPLHVPLIVVVPVLAPVVANPDKPMVATDGLLLLHTTIFGAGQVVPVVVS